MYETHSFTLLFNISLILHSGNKKVLTNSENHSNVQPHTYISPLETAHLTYIESHISSWIPSRGILCSQIANPPASLPAGSEI
jgi:hypothetical protein